MDQPQQEVRRRRWAAWLRRAGVAYVVFAVAVFTFVAATFYTDMRVRELGAISGDASRNALPSVLHLSSVRADLRRLEVDPARVHALREDIEAHVAGYRQTPMFAGEEAMWQPARHDIDEVYDAAARYEEARTNDPARLAPAQQRLSAAISAADASIERVVDLNYASGLEASGRFQKLETRVTETAYALDALSFFLSLIATILAYRAFRRYSRYLEDRTVELQRFADRVAHDVRGPLSPALMALSLAANDFPAEHPRQRTLARGIRSLKMCASIIEALLAFARSGAQPDPDARAPLGEAVRHVLDEASAAAAASRVDLRAEPIQDLDLACAPGVLASLLSNLVHNAIKYMGDSSERRVVVRASVEGARARVEVEDTGPGIPPESRETIFDPYVRLGRAPTTEGLGLGLATVKRLVDAHGGKVGVSSRAGCTRFWFELPRADRDHARFPRISSASQGT